MHRRIGFYRSRRLVWHWLALGLVLRQLLEAIAGHRERLRIGAGGELLSVAAANAEEHYRHGEDKNDNPSGSTGDDGGLGNAVCVRVGRFGARFGAGRCACGGVSGFRGFSCRLRFSACSFRG